MRVGPAVSTHEHSDTEQVSFESNATWDTFQEPTESVTRLDDHLTRDAATFPMGPKVLGQRFGKYEIVDIIQKGGMGELLLADIHEENGRRTRVVLKRLLADFLADERYVRMFLDEAEVMSKLDHPNIVKVIDVPSIDGKQCLALEYVHGRSLLHVLKRCTSLGTPMPPRVAMFIIGEVLKGLEYAHDYVMPDGKPLNLVHRDVTPGNLLLSYTGEVKITDFGIAKSKMSAQSTTVGIVKGTTGYLSPEQICGGPATPRSDLFSAVTVLVEMLTGLRLFDRGAVPATLFAIATGDRPDIGKVLPFEAPLLAALLERSLSVDALRRPSSARELRESLEAASAELGKKLDREALSAFLRELFPEAQAPMAAFEGDEPSVGGLDSFNLTYLFELHQPVLWASDKHHIPEDAAPELERVKRTLTNSKMGARPLDAGEFEGRMDRGPPPPPPASEPEISVPKELVAIPPSRSGKTALPPEPAPRRASVGRDLLRDLDLWSKPPREPPAIVEQVLALAEKESERVIKARARGRSSPRAPEPGPAPSGSPSTRRRRESGARVYLAWIALYTFGLLSGVLVAKLGPFQDRTPPPWTPAIEIANVAPTAADRISRVESGPDLASRFGKAASPLDPSRSGPMCEAQEAIEAIAPAEPTSEAQGRTHAARPAHVPAQGSIDVPKPRGARVVVDGQPVAQRAPISDYKLPTGNHKVTIIFGGQKKSFTFNLKRGARVDLTRLKQSENDAKAAASKSQGSAR
jgi:serine/threonine protein kinase